MAKRQQRILRAYIRIYVRTLRSLLVPSLPVKKSSEILRMRVCVCWGFKIVFIETECTALVARTRKYVRMRANNMRKREKKKINQRHITISFCKKLPFISCNIV